MHLGAVRGYFRTCVTVQWMLKSELDVKEIEKDLGDNFAPAVKRNEKI